MKDTMHDITRDSSLRKLILKIPQETVSEVIEIDPYSCIHKPRYCWRPSITNEQKEQICEAVMKMVSGVLYVSYGLDGQAVYYKILRVYFDVAYVRLLADVEMINPENPVLVMGCETMEISPSYYNEDYPRNIYVTPIKDMK